MKLRAVHHANQTINRAAESGHPERTATWI